MCEQVNVSSNHPPPPPPKKKSIHFYFSAPLLAPLPSTVLNNPDPELPPCCGLCLWSRDAERRPSHHNQGTFCVERPAGDCLSRKESPLLHSSRVKHGCQLFLPEENLGEEISGSRGIILRLLSQRFHAPVTVSGRAGETFSAGAAGRSRSISGRKWGREHSDGPPAAHS